MRGIEFSEKERTDIDYIKKDLMYKEDKEQVLLVSDLEQKIKLIKLGSRVYEVTCNYGKKSFDHCLVDMYLSK